MLAKFSAATAECGSRKTGTCERRQASISQLSLLSHISLQFQRRQGKRILRFAERKLRRDDPAIHRDRPGPGSAERRSVVPNVRALQVKHSVFAPREKGFIANYPRFQAWASLPHERACTLVTFVLGTHHC